MSGGYAEDPFGYDWSLIPGVLSRRVRGPVIDRRRPYMVCLGAAQTFGRFVHDPFPARLSSELGIAVQNLGIGGAGASLFGEPAVLEFLNGAKVVVVQALSGRSMPNSMFKNPDGNVDGHRVLAGGALSVDSVRLRDIVNELICERRFDELRRIVAESQDAWVRETSRLLRAIRVPTVLLWFSTRSPDHDPDWRSVHGVFGEFPQLVTRSMVERATACADRYVEVVSRQGLPQDIGPAGMGLIGTVDEGGRTMNRYYPSPQMHELAASALVPVCRELLALG